MKLVDFIEYYLSFKKTMYNSYKNNYIFFLTEKNYVLILNIVIQLKKTDS